jgi:hypothetical protein
MPCHFDKSLSVITDQVLHEIQPTFVGPYAPLVIACVGDTGPAHASQLEVRPSQTIVAGPGLVPRHPIKCDHVDHQQSLGIGRFWLD